MTSTTEVADVHPGRQRVSIAIALAVIVPALVIRFTAPSIPHPVEALLYGLAIVGSAFLLSWAAEVAQLDISAGLAIAVLAFIAVLPEYAVDVVFAKDGGRAVSQFGAACRSAADIAAGRDSACSLAVANMTGSNRLLIGIGWSLVVLLAFWRARKIGARAGVADEVPRMVELERVHSVEVAYLAIATLYCLTLPLRRTVTMLDAAVLIGIFALYTIRISRAPADEPHLVGPAYYIGTFSVRGRRTTVIAMFLGAALVIFLCAEHFADSLVATGRTFGISEFLLVQWLAPLASEAPELLVAGMYAWRLNTSSGLGTLVSSKVNQWTLLIGTLPIAFSLFSGTLHGLPIGAGQREELLLTAAQSVFAVAVIADLGLGTREAWILATLFWTQFFLGALLPDHVHGVERIVFSIIYLVLAVAVVLRERNMRALLTDGFRTPYAEMQ